ncbi:MAG TPA: hypothetical protein ENH94_04935 [Phycisphaerales bacterium]|nr:hypothetical protein [Phycisphaerales bacterium]
MKITLSVPTGGSYLAQPDRWGNTQTKGLSERKKEGLVTFCRRQVEPVPLFPSFQRTLVIPAQAGIHAVN